MTNMINLAKTPKMKRTMSVGPKIEKTV